MDKHFTEHFNSDLYLKIREAREKEGLSVISFNEEIKDHELIGREFISRKTTDRYTVKFVNKNWDNGWYEVLFLENREGLFRPVVWRNIDCQEEKIWQQIEDNRNELYFLNDDGRYINTLKH